MRACFCLSVMPIFRCLIGLRWSSGVEMASFETRFLGRPGAIMSEFYSVVGVNVFSRLIGEMMTDVRQCVEAVVESLVARKLLNCLKSMKCWIFV
jgi:hypothetical protein